MRAICISLAIAAALVPAAVAAAQGAQPHPGEHGHKIVPVFEGGKFIDLLSGDPSKAGAPFVIRIRNFDNQVVPPHWHPEDEHIVLISGRWFLAEGDTFDRSKLRELKAGDYALMPKRMNHFGWSIGETVIQVHGIGPFEIKLVDPWMRLSDPEAAKFFKFRADQQVLSARGNGVIKAGYHSDKNKVTQYRVEKPDGGVFFAFESELAEAR